MMTTFPDWHELSRRAYERIHAPVVVDGVEFLALPVAAARIGCTAQWLRVRCKDVPGVFVVLTGRGGLRFFRLPRHPGDQRAPVYVDVRTI